MTANLQNNCQNCDGVGSVVEYIEGEQGVCVTTCPSCDGTGAVAKPLDDEDKTPKPPTAADIPDVIWEIAERAFHESALVADDSKCVEIYARALLAVPPSIPAGGVRELAEAIIEREFAHLTGDQSVSGPLICRRIREAADHITTLSLPAGGVAVSDALPRVRHKKRGTEYEVLGVGKMQAEFWFNERLDTNVDMREVTIYRGDDGQMWVRPVEEFEDGRFESALSPEAKTGGR